MIVSTLFTSNVKRKLDSLKTVGENKKNADIVVVLFHSDHRSIVAAFTLQD